MRLSEWILFADASPGSEGERSDRPECNETTFYIQINQPQLERLGPATTRASLFWPGLRVGLRD